MGADNATRAVLKDLATERALTRGDESIVVVRAAYDRVFGAWTAGASAPTNEHWTEIDVADQKSKALIIEPALKSAIGTIIFFHGGGWSLGTALCYAPLGRALAAESGMRVIVPDFPQAPENPFPAAYDLLVGVTEWAVDKYAGPLFLSGDSAGGNLAAAISADNRVALNVRGQALFYPVLDLRQSARYRSRRRFGNGKYFLSEAGILGAAAAYCGETGDASDPRISPILNQHKDNTPPTFLFLPEFDPLKDEGEKYAALLKKDSVPVEVFRAPGTIHGCVSFSGRIPQGGEGIRRAAAFLAGRV